MKHIILVFLWLILDMDCFAFNWENTVNEGSIIIDNNSVISGSSSSSTVRGSGNLIKEKRTLDVFDKFVINVVADVSVTSGKQYHLSIEGDDNIIKIISTDIVNQQLIISSKKSYSALKPLKITIEVPFLKKVKQSGTGTIFMDNITKDTMKMILSGNGAISAKGQVKFLNAEIDGSGTLNLQELTAQNVKIRIDGVGDASVQVLNRLDVDIQGVGNVSYSGNPTIINKSIIGMGSVIQR